MIGFVTAGLAIGKFIIGKAVQGILRTGSDAKEVAISAMSHNTELQKARSEERKHLMGTKAYTALMVFVVGGPALYINAVYLDSVLPIEGWNVEQAPKHFHDAAFEIVKSFAGVGGAGLAGIIAIAKLSQWWKR